MSGPHPLQRFLDRHGQSQTTFAARIGVTRETVNRWIRLRTTPFGENLLRALSVVRQVEPAIQAAQLFPISDPNVTESDDTPRLDNWGDECVLCEIPWDEPTEHLPLALLDPDLGDHPLGDLCESCARSVSIDDSDCTPRHE